MLDKVRARIAGNRDDRGRFVSKGTAPELSPKRITFMLGRERIELGLTTPEERAALNEIKLHARVGMRNRLGMASALARTKYPLFEGVKKGRTPAAKRRAAHQARKTVVAARSATAQGRAA